MASTKKSPKQDRRTQFQGTCAVCKVPIPHGGAGHNHPVIRVRNSGNSNMPLPPASIYQEPPARVVAADPQSLRRRPE
jgi:hypothetical protein